MQTRYLVVGILLVAFIGGLAAAQSAYNGEKLYLVKTAPNSSQEAVEQYTLEYLKHADIPRTLLRSLEHPVFVEFGGMFSGYRIAFYPSNSLRGDEIQKLATEAMKRVPISGMVENADLVGAFAQKCWETKPKKNDPVFDVLDCSPYRFTFNVFHGSEYEPPFVIIIRDMPKADYDDVLNSLVKKGKGLPLAVKQFPISPENPLTDIEMLWISSVVSKIDSHKSKFRSTPTVFPIMVETDLSISPYNDNKLVVTGSAKHLTVDEARQELYNKLFDIRWYPITESRNAFYKERKAEGLVRDKTSEIRYKIATQGDLLVGELFFKTLPHTKKP